MSRRFGEAWAVKAASLTFAAGTIHAVVGENGAGKSTLLRMAASLLRPTSGDIFFNGVNLAAPPAGSAKAVARGIAMVHQHFMLVEAFSPVENIVLGFEPRMSFGRVDWRKAERTIRALLEDLGIQLPLHGRTGDLGVGERQKLELVRCLYRGAQTLLLDEPTAVLSPLEANELFRVLHRLKREGRAIALVTHRLDEVLAHADRVSVMRQGELILDAPLGDSSALGQTKAARTQALTAAIMGGAPPDEIHVEAVSQDRSPWFRLVAVGLEPGDGSRLGPLDLDIRKGEVVGIAGVEGNGQRELVRVLAGLEKTASGTLHLGDAAFSVSAKAKVARALLGIVHEDRHRDGLVLEASVSDNLIVGEWRRSTGALDERATVLRRINEFEIRPADPTLPAGALSGGNQQKIVVARAFDRFSACSSGALVLAHPTRGVDIGAAGLIHQKIAEMARRGLCVLIISSDLNELRAISHRLLVMRKGKWVAELSTLATDEEIGRYMLGVEAA